MKGQNKHIVVVMVPLPAQGHLNQLLHLSHIITTYGIPVHYAGSATHNRQAKVRINGWDSQSLSKIYFHDFELPPYDSPPPKHDPSIPFPDHLQPLFEASTHLREPVSRLMQQLSVQYDRLVVVHDILMTYVIQDVRLIPNGETYNFIPTSTFTFFVQAWSNIPKETKQLFQLESNDIPEYIPSEEGCHTQEMNEFALKQIKHLGFESGWIYNTSSVIEGRYIHLLEKLNAQIKHFALGPFNPVDIRTESGTNSRNQCLKWLDEQEKGSVIFVSFGSTTSLTDDQFAELADGLERSGEKFIWVVRRADQNNVFAETDTVKRPQIPAGYEERVKDRGLVMRDWAPQLEILAHSSVGGFMSHCGWNSCMESISMGVPIATWPMHSDQPKNAILVTEVLKIGVSVRDWKHRSEIVKASGIEDAVRKLMGSEEGKVIQKRAAEIGEAIRRSVDKGGGASLERDSFIAHISRE